MSLPPLDEATKARLRWEAERLAMEENMPLAEARRIVWLDYQDELATAPGTVSAVPPQPEPATPAEPKPGGKPFWNARDEPAFTPTWLERNRQQLAQVKRLIGVKQ